MNEVIKAIHSLRTIHGNFTEKEVTDDDLLTVIDACTRAANASARQSYSIIAVREKEVMKKLCGYAGSVGLVFCVDYNRIVDTAKYLNVSFEVNGMVDFITGSTDTILATQTAVIAAKSLGIDSILTNGIHRGDMKRVYKLLDLPENYCFPLIMAVFGYSNQETCPKV